MFRVTVNHRLGFFSTLFAVAVVHTACDTTEFSAKNGTRKPIVQPTPGDFDGGGTTGGSTGGGTGGDSTGDGGTTTGRNGDGTVIMQPQSCSSATLKAAPVGRNCPDNYGVFGIDDPTSSQSFGTLACCPLPANDILIGDLITRAQRCQANEVMVGNSGSGVNCRAINTTRYSLRAAEVCYFGDGSSGQGGAPRCRSKGVIPTEFAAFASPSGGGFMGNDGCLNFPYGALSVGQAGKNCDQQSAMQLFTSDGSPVTMFK